MRALAVASLAYVLTALMGVWTAFDRPAALLRFALLAVGVLGMWLLARAGRAWAERVDRPLSVASALLAAALGGYFLLSQNWQVAQALVRLPPPDDLNPNVAGGALALVLPLGVVALNRSLGQQRRVESSVLGLALLVAGIALAQTASRGAWLGLGAGLAVAAAWRWAAGRRQAVGPVLQPRHLPLLAVALVALTLLLGALADRLWLWAEMWDLTGDYLWTGSGLGSTMMAFSTYVLLAHVGHTAHAHNLLLQVAVEQGLPGLAAFGSLLALATLRLRPGSPFSLAVMVAFVALVVHGTVDAGLYSSRLVPLVFLPLGMAWAAAPVVPARTRVSPRDEPSPPWGRIAAGVGLLLSLVVLALAGGRASLEANLGAVAQARAELSRYHWPAWPIQDSLRRSPEVNLEPAQRWFYLALRHDSAQATAARRLAQIELARGSLATARELLERAYQRAPQHNATRLLLGECYALAGQVEQAAALWRTVDRDEGQLAARQWWHREMGEEQGARWIEQAQQLAESPGGLSRTGR